MKKQYVWPVIGVALLVAGIALGMEPFSGYLRERNVPRVSASPFDGKTAAQEPAEPVVYKEGVPVRLEVSSLGIDLEVAEGKYNTKSQTWTLSNDKAHYAVMTPPANNKAGNTFIYGHNRKGVFRDLSRIQLGDKAILTTANGHRFTYVFKGALETVPSDTALFEYKGKPILTLQTCSGAFYENRQLFTFDLEHVE